MALAKKAILCSVICAAVTLTPSSPSFASSESGSTRYELFNLHESPPQDHSGYRVHFNVGAGYGTVAGNSYQSNPAGEHFLTTVSVGRRTHHWEWDTGLGWGYSRRTGTDQSGNPVAITIRSARADVSGRYRIFPRWEVGPIMAVTFGTDTRFELHLGDSVGTFYGGLKSTLDLTSIGAFPLEAWGEALTELSQPGRDAFTTIVGLRISLPVIHRIDQVETSSAAPRRDVRVVLDANRVFFRTDSSKLRPDFANALHELAGYLSKNSDRWDSIEIAGHTDKRGPLDYNMRLSKRRATSVETELLSHGIASSRIQVESFGPTKPLDLGGTKWAYAKNRRVELVFKNVSDAGPLLQKLAPLKGEPVLYHPER